MLTIFILARAIQYSQNFSEVKEFFKTPEGQRNFLIYRDFRKKSEIFEGKNTFSKTYDNSIDNWQNIGKLL